jgi:DNA-binding MarR family transcriptional regulator
MVQRRPDPTDARAVRLSLTAHGVDVIDQAVPVVRALNDELLNPVGGADSAAAAAFAETLRALLRAAPQPDPHPRTITTPGGGSP